MQNRNVKINTILSVSLNIEVINSLKLQLLFYKLMTHISTLLLSKAIFKHCLHKIEKKNEKLIARSTLWSIRKRNTFPASF